MLKLWRTASTWRTTLGLTASLVVAACSVVACSDDASSGNDGQGNGGNGEGKEPIYLYQVAVYTPNENFQYDLLRHTLDFNISVDDLKTAREFSAYTGIVVIDGHVIAGDSETPFTTKFRLNDDLSWTPIGEPLNFGRYFTADGDGLNFYFQSVRGNDMYFFHGADRTSRVHWNVDRWTIENNHQDTQLPTRAGWTLNNTGNRTGVRDFVGPVMQSFHLTNDETGMLSDASWIAVYDPETHAERAVIEVPCPGMQQVTLDEDGNAYFSTTFNAPTFALYKKAPASCVVKVKADGTLDESFAPNDLTAWTGGFHGVNFRYLGGGKAVANVLHHDRLGVTFDGEVDPAVQTRIEGLWSESGSTPQDATVWELHVIDLASGTSKIVTGFRPEHDVGSYSIFQRVDGRVLITFQFDVEEITNNAVYELDLAAATVTHVGSVAGELGSVVRVR